MKMPARNVLWLAPLLLAACTHKTPQVQNQTLAPPVAKLPPPNTSPVELPPSTTTIPPQPTQNAQEPTQPVKPVAPPRRKPSPSTPAATADQTASEPAGVSAIGQLSSGDPADMRRETDDMIVATDRDLGAIHRTLSSSEQATADHIREFLKQAKAALTSGDVDGAHTLASKAKVLLSELTNP